MGIPSLIGKYIWQYKHSNLFTYVGNNEKCWKLIFDSLLHPIKDNIINELIDPLA